MAFATFNSKMGEAGSAFFKELVQTTKKIRMEAFQLDEEKRIKAIYINRKTKELCIRWFDDSVTSAKCSEGDTFDVYVGFCLAFTKKMIGSNTKMRKLVDRKFCVDKKNKGA